MLTDERRNAESHRYVASRHQARPPAAAARERELARWDGTVLAIDSAPYLNGPTGAVMVSVGIRQGDERRPTDWTHQPMARLPMPNDLLQLLAVAAAGWDRRDRLLLVVKVRSLDPDPFYPRGEGW